MKAPFPYFGGKSRIAPIVWQRFGSVRSYVEPFFGSGAMLLNRPPGFAGTETVNDKDGMICNFWRALQADPNAVAHHANWPVNENDLHARHAWLVGQKDSLQARLEGDANYYNVGIAGWWVWGMACWIGGGFCSGKGPWLVVDGLLVRSDHGEGDVSRQRVHLGDAGRGVNRKMVHLGDAGRGVNRKLVHLSDAGQGVNRQLVHLGNAGQGVKRQRVHLNAGRGEPQAGDGECGLLAWIQALAQRLQRVRVCCGDWTRVCGGKSGNALHLFFVTGEPCGIFLDPPYLEAAGRDMGIYNHEDGTVANAVREWAIAHGDDPRLRIALCGYEGEHKMPRSWKCVAWKAKGGMGHMSDKRGSTNCHRERIWFSPHCLAAPLKKRALCLS